MVDLEVLLPLCCLLEEEGVVDLDALLLLCLLLEEDGVVDLDALLLPCLFEEEEVVFDVLCCLEPLLLFPDCRACAHTDAGHNVSIAATDRIKMFFFIIRVFMRL